MKLIKVHSLAAACGALFLATLASAQVKPSALFSDHMVLQSGMPVPVWGTADPGEKVTVKLEGKTRPPRRTPTGKWMVRLAKLKPGGPFEMTIAGKIAGEAPRSL